MTANIGTIANRFSGLRELSQVTNTYGGYLISDGLATDLVLPWQADRLELYNYSTGANPINWFRDMPAGTAMGGGLGSGSSYGYAYALTPQTVASYTALGTGEVLFDAVGPSSGVSTTLGQADIVVANAGTYLVSFSVSGTGPNQFAIFVNDVPQPSTVGGSGAGTQQNTISSILTLPAGAVINLVNYITGSGVGLATTVGGSAANVTANVTISSLGSTVGSQILTNGITIDNLLGGFTKEQLVISGITAATPPVITTTTNHNLSNMDRVVITKVIGTMAQSVNNNTYVVQVLSPTTFSLYDTYGVPITLVGTYTSSGQVTKIGPLLGDVTEPISPAVRHNAIIDYPPEFRLLLGTSVVGSAGNVIYFEATQMNAYFNLGNLV
jgi:hypothetical protein